MKRSRAGALVVAGAAAVVGVACSSFRDIRGRLSADDAPEGVVCAVTAHRADYADAYPDVCRVEGVAARRPREAVPLGARFACRVSANVDHVYVVRADCPGYAPLEVTVATGGCGRLFGGCDPIEIGTLLVRRTS